MIYEEEDSYTKNAQEQQNRLAQMQQKDDVGLVDYVYRMGEAGLTGAAHGLMSQGPEQLYRSARTLGTIVGNQSIQDWATEKIQAIKLERETDPFYQPDPEIMKDSVHRAIYEGMQSVTSSLETSALGIAGGLAAAAATGGTAAVPVLLGFATNAGLNASLAEYDNFVEQAYDEFKVANPSLTMDDVRQQVNTPAIKSALAEGGLELAGDLIAGKLLGVAGKAVGVTGGTLGRDIALKFGEDAASKMVHYRTVAAKLLKGALITGPMTEVPSEMATAALQDWARESAGMESQGMWAAAKGAIGPSIVAGMAFGGAGAAVEHVGTKKNSAEDLAKILTAADQARIKAEADAKEQFIVDPVVRLFIKNKQSTTLTKEEQSATKTTDTTTETSEAGTKSSVTQSHSEVHTVETIGDTVFDSLKKDLSKDQQSFLDEVYQKTGDKTVDEQMLNDFRTYISRNNKLPEATQRKLEESGQADSLKAVFSMMKTGMLNRLSKAHSMGVVSDEELKQADYLYEGIEDAQHEDLLKQLEADPDFINSVSMTHAAITGVIPMKSQFEHGDGKNLNQTAYGPIDAPFREMLDETMGDSIQKQNSGTHRTTAEIRKAARAVKGDATQKMAKIEVSMNAVPALIARAKMDRESLMKISAEAALSGDMDKHIKATAALVANGFVAERLGSSLGRGLKSIDLAKEMSSTKATYERALKALDSVKPGLQRNMEFIRKAVAESAASSLANDIVKDKTTSSSKEYTRFRQKAAQEILTKLKNKEEISSEYSQVIKVVISEGRWQKQAQDMMAESRGGVFTQGLLGYATNGMLSNLSTPVVAMAGNGMALFQTLIEKTLAKHMTTSEFGIQDTEGLSHGLWGAVHGFVDSVKLGLKTFRTGEGHSVSEQQRAMDLAKAKKDVVYESKNGSSSFDAAYSIGKDFTRSTESKGVPVVTQGTSEVRYADNGTEVTSEESSTFKDTFSSVPQNQSEFQGDLKSTPGSSMLYVLGMAPKSTLTREQLSKTDGWGPLAAMIHDVSNKVGWAIGIPGRAMLGVDEMFWQMSRNIEHQQIAARTAMRGVKLGVADFQTLFDQAMQDETIREASKTFADMTTFQTPLSGLASKADEIRNWKLGGVVPIGKFIVPFFKTPVNVASWAAMRTPGIAYFFEEHRKMLNSEDPAQVQLAEARVIAGSMLWYAGLMAAASGLVTGAGPSDPEEKKLLMATGWKQFSAKIGDSYVELNRLDPIASFFSIAASVAESAEYADDQSLSAGMMAGLSAGVKAASDKYMLAGVSQALMLMKDVDRNGAAWIQKMAPMFMPFSGLSRSTRQLADPFYREVNSVADALQNTTPGLSAALPFKRTVLGEKVGIDGGVMGTSLISPVKIREAKTDPVYEELLRLRRDPAANMKLGMPERTIEFRKEKIPLTPEQYDRMQEIAGSEVKVGGMTMKEKLSSLFGSESYTGMTEEQKKSVTSATINTYRSMAKKRMLQELGKSDVPWLFR